MGNLLSTSPNDGPSPPCSGQGNGIPFVVAFGTQTGNDASTPPHGASEAVISGAQNAQAVTPAGSTPTSGNYDGSASPDGASEASQGSNSGLNQTQVLPPPAIHRSVADSSHHTVGVESDKAMQDGENVIVGDDNAEKAADINMDVTETSNKNDMEEDFDATADNKRKKKPNDAFMSTAKKPPGKEDLVGASEDEDIKDDALDDDPDDGDDKKPAAKNTTPLAKKRNQGTFDDDSDNSDDDGNKKPAAKNTNHLAKKRNQATLDDEEDTATKRMRLMAISPQQPYAALPRQLVGSGPGSGGGEETKERRSQRQKRKSNVVTPSSEQNARPFFKSIKSPPKPANLGEAKEQNQRLLSYIKSLETKNSNRGRATVLLDRMIWLSGNLVYACGDAEDFGYALYRLIRPDIALADTDDELNHKDLLLIQENLEDTSKYTIKEMEDMYQKEKRAAMEQKEDGDNEEDGNNEEINGDD